MNMLLFRSHRMLVPACVFALIATTVCTLWAFWQPASDETFRTWRLEMVSTQIEGRGVKNKAVLAALQKVPRHRFVPATWRGLAYSDQPLPIGEGQTISQPYIVGWMTELIEPTKRMRVLEIGTGSGYQAAVLAECVGEVDTVEVVSALGKKAESLLGELGYRNIRVRIGDGYEGWLERAALRRDRPDGRTSQPSSATAARTVETKRTACGSCRPQ